MKLSSSFLFVVALSGLIASCAVEKKLTPREPEPIDYWMLKRSHEVHGFDQAAYLNGIQEVRNLKLQKTGPDLNLNWELEGPFNIGGRINVVTPLTRTSDTLFCGAANGGVFRSYDAGNQWTPVFDDFSYLSIGAITVDPSNTQTVFVGTGDRNFGGSSYNGNGLYRSNDLGDTWTNIGLNQVGIITSVIVHSQNSDHILVGALGSGFEKSNERGVFRSTDGGTTWTNTLFVSDSSGVCEMVEDPTNSDIVYACFFNRVNLLDRSISKGPDSKIYKSTDGGATWNQLTNGLPSTELSRVGVAVSESNPNKLYAVYVGTGYNVEEIYVSNDAGATWNGINANSGSNGLDPNALGGFGWYFGRIHVNPFNENHIILPGVDQYESTDGGQSWNMNVPIWWTYEVHADKHALYFKDTNTMIIGTDGGMYKTTNGATTWNILGELPITQFYRVTGSTFTPGVYAGGAQDNGSTSGNQNGPWTRDFGGDGFQSTYVDAATNTVVYETQRGVIHWTDAFNGVTSLNVNSIDPNENTNWNTPYVVFEGSQALLAGSNRLLYMAAPPFDTWAPISNDLTLSGLGQAPVNRYHTITELAYNPLDEDQVLVGTSDGLVWKGSISGGMNNWVNITGTLPSNYVTSVNFSKKQAGTIYVTMSGYYSGFSSALVFKSIDNGATWIDISNNLPAIGVNDLITVISTPGNEELLFIGTDAGVFVSEDEGQTWDLMGSGLPIITIDAIDVSLSDRKIIAGTYGRSMWSYDISAVLGVEESNEFAEALVYPNPTSGEIHLSQSADDVRIYTIDGKLVFEMENYEADKLISLDHLLPGHYVIQLDDKRVNLKIE